MDPVLLIPNRRWPRPALWLDASQASTLTLEDTTRVAGWASRGSASVTLTATGDPRPVYVADGIGGRPAVQFDGVDAAMDATAAPLTGTAGTVITVAQYGDLTTTQILLCQTDVSEAAINVYVSRNSSTWPAYVQRLISNTALGASPASGNAAITHSVNYIQVWTTSGAEDTVMRANGKSATVTESISVKWFGYNTNSDTLVLGAADRSTGKAGFHGGLIAEVMAWNSVLPTSEIRSAERYLAGKYGITLA